MSISLLGKRGVRILFNFDKIVVTKNDAFVGKGYCNQGLLKKMVELSLIFKLSLENHGKCESCVE